MGKTDSIPVPNPEDQSGNKQRGHSGQQEPLSGSKKTKQHNHTPHHNRQG
ncbi:hypothetical protein Back11_46450 [Paenibacillus baekrokdamisoli]|uniref:Uncharacterized protein n=1 Tax=Paenibacillus baekrokdamisoli TaxID=1712516 RepID=A0A3G9IWR6_9BACL|nr:small acid-soluble spore protein P [Paenibacillus baekrokdamisoli]MBB3073268.1 small acid-soluble spore protein P (minor) [Paenibacillus baekrokdamisoli]BBH23300.1 hypothetical protein Back11_46450 [Paenibacillus baekrokdamisoli]